MQLQQLEYFLSAVEHGSFSGAARAVNLAQPAFSRHIRALENDLGVVLFERSVGGVRLTHAGQRLRRRASSILRRVDQVRQEVTVGSEDPAGTVQVTIAAHLAPLLSGEVFWDVRNRFPRIDLRLLDVYRVMGDQLLQTGQVDFALLPNSAAMTGLEFEPAMAQNFYLVGTSFPPEVSDTVPMRDLRHYPLVMGGRTNQLRIDLEHIALREGHPINVAYEQDSLAVRRSTSLTGPAFTVVPYSTFADDIIEGRLKAREIVEPSIVRVVSFAWQRASELSAAASAVKQSFQDRMVALTKAGKLRGRILFDH